MADSTNVDSPLSFHIGTGRAGSTFLFHLIKSHPDLVLSASQEIGYYSDYYYRGRDWYLKQFIGQGTCVDTSPAYFVRGAEVAQRIKAELGEREPRFLLILRNPVDYTYSHYLMRRNTGYFERNRSLYPKKPRSFIDLYRRYPAYLGRGRYFEILATHWLTHFEKESFKVALFEDLIRDPQSFVDEVLEFWGVSRLKVSTPEISKNITLRHPYLYRARSWVVQHEPVKRILKDSPLFNWFYARALVGKEPLSESAREEVRPYFAEDVRRLEALTGLDLAKWRERD